MDLLRKKKFLIYLILAIFSVIVIVSFVQIFALKNIDATFTVTDKTKSSAAEIIDKLDDYKNSNILFLNVSDIKNQIESNPYFEVKTIKKSYPNTLTIEVIERPETYYFNFYGMNYILDSEGFCLAVETDAYVQTKRLIELKLVNIAVTELSVGKTLVIAQDNALLCALNMAKAVNLGNCISEMTLYGKSGYAVFNTYTGVRIDISKYAVNDGVQMIQNAFEEYDQASDYIRTYNRIIAYTLDNGEIRLTWTSELTDYE